MRNMDIKKIYQEILIENSRDKSNVKSIDANYIERGHNPSCGDDLTLLVKIEDDLIKDASYLGSGCAISTASMNILINLIKNKKIKETKKILNTFFKMMNENKEFDVLEDANILMFTNNMPARVKCTTLSWHSLKVILDKYDKKGEI